MGLLQESLVLCGAAEQRSSIDGAGGYPSSWGRRVVPDRSS